MRTHENVLKRAWGSANATAVRRRSTSESTEKRAVVRNVSGEGAGSCARADTKAPLPSAARIRLARIPDDRRVLLISLCPEYRHRSAAAPRWTAHPRLGCCQKAWAVV